MKSYGQYCPIARGAEIFATRWTPIIMRNLMVGCRTYSEICDGAPGIPRTLLSERLRMLEVHGVVQRRPRRSGRGYDYELTESGRDLAKVCTALGQWGERWIELTPEHLDPYVCLWSLCRTLDVEAIGPRRTTVRFEFRDEPAHRRRFWLVVHRPAPEVCVKPPGYDEDAVVLTDPEWLARWRLGEYSLPAGVRDARVTVQGPRAMLRTLEEWARQSHASVGEPVHE